MRTTIFFTAALSSLLLCTGYSYGQERKTKAGTYSQVENWPQLPTNYVLGNPTGLDMDRDQNLVVFTRAYRTWTDPMPDSLITANTVLILDRRTGKIINSWGAGLFIMPHGLTVDKDNNIWLTDVGLHQVFKFSHSGKLLMKLGEAKVAGADKSHFNLPTDVAIAADGSFYVSDGYGNSRVVKFSASGQYLFEWGKKGNGRSEFNIPHAIHLDSKGNVYVADRENSRIQSFTAEGKFIKEWKAEGSGYIYSLVLNKKDDIVAVDYLKVNDTVIKGSSVLDFNQNDKAGRGAENISMLRCPSCRYHDLAIDKDGDLYIGDIRSNRLLKLKRK